MLLAPCRTALGSFFLCCCFFLVLTASPCLAQKPEYLPYYSADTTQVHSLALTNAQTMRQRLTVPANVSAAYRRDFLEIVESSAKNSYQIVRQQAVLDTIIAPYLQGIFKKVLHANKELEGKTTLVLTKSPIENAYALADGTVFFNIGLLAELENEDQIAFVLCHELAHVKLRHMEQGILEYLETVHSKDFKKRYNQLAREKYNRSAKIATFFEEKSLSHLYHKRSLEKQADSVGFLLFTKTSYDPSQAATALKILARVDDPTAVPHLNLNTYFGCPDFTLDGYIKSGKETSIFGAVSDESLFVANKDTLQTHPDIDKRLRYIEELERSMPTTGKVIEAERGNKVKDICQREALQSWFDAQNYDYAAYKALQQLQLHPESNYLRGIVMLSLYAMQQHLKAHTFSEILSVESPRQPEGFNQLIRLFGSLETSAYKNLSQCFHEAAPLRSATDEYTLAARYALARLQDDVSAAAEAKNAYTSRYKLGRLQSAIFPEQP
jgi:Zn-dependent protease with chaperone function